MLAYTAHAEHSTDEPPSFAVAGADDAIAPPAAMHHRIEAQRRIDIAVEFLRFGSIGHGFCNCVGTSAEGRIVDSFLFWENVVYDKRLR
ncbi:MAG: hypothetical protein JNK11_01195 [Alphaproteobacteria bacterium]|nr:hypothetical protein [Alphaproteobacteria bacterium]